MLNDENDSDDFEDGRPIWLERERATARLVQRCFKLLMDGPKTAPEKLHALCKLTWITKGNGKVANNTRSVVVPALNVLLNDELSATDKSSLAKELLQADTPPEIVEAASHDVGFVNFYSAFRNTSQEWIAANRHAVWNALSTAANARNDADAQRAYRIVDKLPSLPRRNGGDLPAFNLLTPILACLDPRERSPVINSREAVKLRLRRLGIANGDLVEQFDDYRRQLDGRAFTDIAVLFPERPDQHATDFLGFVGVKVLWFSQDMTRIEGDVILQGAG